MPILPPFCCASALIRTRGWKLSPGLNPDSVSPPDCFRICAILLNRSAGGGSKVLELLEPHSHPPYLIVRRQTQPIPNLTAGSPLHPFASEIAAFLTLLQSSSQPDFVITKTAYDRSTNQKGKRKVGESGRPRFLLLHPSLLIWWVSNFSWYRRTYARIKGEQMWIGGRGQIHLINCGIT